MINLIPIYKMTFEKWNSLSDNEKSNYPNEGANWYNTNYYYCGIQNALAKGIIIDPDIWDSIDQYFKSHLLAVGYNNQ